jgi:ATP-dependent DNA ligase
MEQIIVNNRQELDDAHTYFLQQEHEGSMIKMLDAPYIPDRTSAMLKRKELEFIDGVILEVLPGKGRNAKWAGSYRVRLTKNGAETSCNIRGDANRADHWERRFEMPGTHLEMTQQKDAKAVSETARFPVAIRVREDLPKEQV